ncbi:MAG: hypothetical protein M3N30_03680, partial [Bacteroidota bacterium]|nr:hypothetical protein [Bacteroidota bacterium]
DKVKSISGREGSFETQLGETIHKRIIEVDKDKSYKKEDMWDVLPGNKSTFISRSLGIKISVDTNWQITIYDYANHQTAFIMEPPTIKNEKGKDIHYTIGIFIKSANDDDKLVDYLNNLGPKNLKKIKISLSDKYEKMIAYEIRDKSYSVSE